MTLLLSTDDGWIISHSNYLNKIYKKVQDNDKICSLEFNDKFFDINSQFLRDKQFAKLEQGILEEEVKKKSRKRKKGENISPNDLEQINYVKDAFLRLKILAAAKNLFESRNNYDNNEGARAIADNFYSESSRHKLANFHGSNEIHTSIITQVANEKYVFPERCSFYCYDVREIAQKLHHTQFNFVLLDPPWWNKFIRRKKEKFVESSYKMMYNEDFAKIPIKNFLKSDGIVAVWCTNAPSHLDSILNEMFPAWGVEYVTRWFWVKVTQSGKPICDFNTSITGKQPYELLIFGRKTIEIGTAIPEKKLIISVPSGVHSHKPPISELVKPFLPENPKCLEIFARYLLPDWTSWGLEVLKFQHLSLYKESGAINNSSKIHKS